MYRFTRTATLNNAAYTPMAMNFATEVCGYLNKTYKLNMKVGMEMFGDLKLYWQFEVDSLENLAAVNTKLMQDKTYWAMLDKTKEIWVHGSLKDTVVNFQV